MAVDASDVSVIGAGAVDEAAVEALAAMLGLGSFGAGAFAPLEQMAPAKPHGDLPES